MVRSALILVAVSATAAPLSAKEFDGPRVEAVAGWSNGERVSGLPVPRGDGFVYGIGAGYDVRLNNFVLGVSGEVSDVTGTTCAQVDVKASRSFAGQACGSEGRALFGGVRFGYVVGARSLLYATGGYVNAKQIGRLDGILDGAQYKGSGSANRDGIRLGAGIEQSIAKHAFLKAEYRYTAVGNRLRDDQHQLVTGVGFRF